MAGTLEQIGKLSHRIDGHLQCIRREGDSSAGSLPYSATLLAAGTEWDLQSDSGMLISGDWYAAKVTIPRSSHLENAKDFKKAREILLRNLTIVSVVRDKQLEEYRVAEKNVKLHILFLEKGTTREDLAGVRQSAERFLYLITRDCAKRVSEDPNISESLKSAMVEFADKLQPLQDRNSLMSKEGFSYDFVPFISFLCETIDRGCKAYRNRLLADCPILLRRDVVTARDSVMLNVTLSDLELFSNLQKLFTESKFDKVLPIITTKYWTVVAGLKKWTPVVSPVYLLLLKGLLQTEKDVSSAFNGLEVIAYESEWKLRSLPAGQPSKVRICVQLLKLLVDLTNHYEPGKSTVTETFPYEFQLFPSGEATDDLYGLLRETVEVSKTVRLDVEGMFAMLRKVPMKELQDSPDTAVRFVVGLLPSMVNLVEEDAAILQKQLNNSHPDLLETFTIYWQQRRAFYTNLVSRLPGNYWKSKAPEVLEIFLQITMNLMEGMSSTDSGQFLRVLDGILIILSELRFDWYVSRVPDDAFVTNGLISSCDSETSAGTRGHLVLQPDKFVEQYRLRFPNLAVPRHFEVLRLKLLLSCVQILTGQQIRNKMEHILDSTVLLVNTIRKLLFHLHRADCSLEQLCNISTEPLQRAVEDFIANPNTSFDDLRIKLERLGDSYYCIRKVDMLPEDPSGVKGTDDRLRNYYAVEIDKYALEDANDITSGAGFFGVLDWSLANLPEKLASIPTVWSRLAYKDCDSLCRNPSPTSVQFCSILKSLNFKRREGYKFPIHLVDLLPDQEKFLVLGQSSAVLAYCGHQVYITYPNRNLLERDESKFREFFETLKVQTRISFRTYDEMMTQCYNHLLVKAESYMRKSMDLESNDVPDDHIGIDANNSVLLIDEVDVYFSEKFTNFSMNLQLMIPGLGLVQREIWNIVTSGDQKKKSITHKVDSFVQENKQQEIHELRVFLSKRTKYDVYDYFYGEKSVTNEELYRNHLDQMIETARFVHLVLPAKLFRINSSGLITVTTEAELAKWHISPYSKTFAYLKLKQTNFTQKVSGGCNYGYFCIPVGTVSYGNLLRNFKLILGVTGAVLDSSGQQRVSMRNLYNVKAKFPTMSSDFPQSQEFKFEPDQNFICSRTESAWRKDIFRQLKAIISQDRSAIVFFDDDDQVEAFRHVYASELERLNVLTVATDRETMERCLDEAGLPWMVTLTTRDMVRGLDYKSSVTVEENGGIHVIQGFFSLDSGDEMQIRNRTARNPNRGTYELIVCFGHLKELTLIGDGEAVADGITYDQLNEGRRRLTERMQARKNDRMEEANRKHNETVEFYRKH